MQLSDLTGRTALVTGATSGIGRAAAGSLAELGASVVLVGRDRQRSEAVRNEIAQKTGNDDVSFLIADLSSQKQVRDLADEFLARNAPLHILLNNAGVVLQQRSETEDGLEETFAVNHLGYFLLTNLLLDRIRESAPARIVSVASDAHHYAGGPLDFDDLQSEKKYRGMQVYGKSKLANILFNRELARRLEGTGVTANCYHPGFVGSNFARNNGGVAQLLMTLANPFNRSPERGARTAVYLCASPDVEGVSGEYFFDEKPKWPKRWAQSDEDAKRLWDVSERLTGLTS